MGEIPAFGGVLEVSLYVDDLERSAAFYQSIFGFEVIDRGDRLYAVGIGAHRQVLLLFKRGASRHLPVGAHDAHGPQHVAFAIPSSDLARWEARLHLHGVAIEETRRWKRGGYSVYFRDPDGHLLELATPGVWSVY